MPLLVHSSPALTDDSGFDIENRYWGSSLVGGGMSPGLGACHPLPYTLLPLLALPLHGQILMRLHNNYLLWPFPQSSTIVNNHQKKKNFFFTFTHIVASQLITAGQQKTRGDTPSYEVMPPVSCSNNNNTQPPLFMILFLVIGLSLVLFSASFIGSAPSRLFLLTLPACGPRHFLPWAVNLWVLISTFCTSLFIPTIRVELAWGPTVVIPAEVTRPWSSSCEAFPMAGFPG